MSWNDIVLLVVVMAGLAALPSASVALVVTRSATHGRANGFAVSAGIVLGDLIFAALALFGMTWMAELLGGLFFFFRLLAGGYLVWLGVQLLRPRPSQPTPEVEPGFGSLLAGFSAGVLLTLGDAKAILFYASLFPALVDLPALSFFEILLLAGITAGSVGGVKAVYAVLAPRIVQRMRPTAGARWLRTGAGAVLIGTGGTLMAKS